MERYSRSTLSEPPLTPTALANSNMVHENHQTGAVYVADLVNALLLILSRTVS